MVVGNYGWYLFNCVPLFCGNANKDGVTPFVFFRDDVDQKTIHDRFTEETIAMGRHAEELTWVSHDTVLFSIPFVGIPLPVPYVLCYHEKQLSGVLK